MSTRADKNRVYHIGVLGFKSQLVGVRVDSVEGKPLGNIETAARNIHEPNFYFKNFNLRFTEI